MKTKMMSSCSRVRLGRKRNYFGQKKKRQERMAQISFIKEISYQKPYSTAHDTSTSFIVKMLTSVMHYLSCEVN